MSIRPKKHYGQNFLNNPGVLRTICKTADIQSGDTILEIGPGTGVLTQELLQQQAQVYAFEIDHELVQELEQKFAKEISNGQLILIEGDVLKTTLPKELTKQPYKLVANIPYYITNLILRTFLSHQHQPSQATLLVQKDVAKRIINPTQESILSLSVKAYGEPEYIMTVSPGSFIPAPKVDSAVLHIHNISRNQFFSRQHETLFFKLIRSGFMHKRKHLASNLGHHIHDKKWWVDTLTTLSYPATVRAESLSLQDWLFLSEKISHDKEGSINT